MNKFISIGLVCTLFLVTVVLNSPSLGAACPDCDIYDGIHSNNTSDFELEAGFGIGFGVGSWGGGGTAAPVWIPDGSNVSLSGFIARPGVPRDEGWLVLDHTLVNTNEIYFSIWYLVYTFAAANEMVLMDFENDNRKIRLSVFGPGHGNYGQLQAVYSTAGGPVTTLIPVAYGTHTVNDENPASPPDFPISRNTLGISLSACGLRLLPGWFTPDSLGTAGTVLPGFDSHASVTGSHLVFGNQFGGGFPVDGYMDDIRVWRCPAPTFTATSTATATATSTHTSTVTETATFSQTASMTPTATLTYTAISSLTPSWTFTPTPSSTVTETYTVSPTPSCQPPGSSGLRVEAVVDPEVRDEITINLFADQPLDCSKFVLVVSPNGNKPSVTLSNLINIDDSTCEGTYLRNMGFGDVGTITAIGEDLCGDPWQSTGEFDREVISGKKVLIIHNRIDPTKPGDETTIQYQLSASSPVLIEIYTRDGQLIRTLVDEKSESGKFQVVWDGRNNYGDMVASDIYVVIVTSSEFSVTEKIIVVK